MGHPGGVAVGVGSLKCNVSKAIVAHRRDALVRQFVVGEVLQQLNVHVHRWNRSVHQVGARGLVGVNRQRFTECFRHLVVQVWRYNHHPIAGWDISGKGAVGVGFDIQPYLISFVVEKELICNAVIGKVGQCTVHTVGVLKRYREGLLGSIKSDVNLSEDDFTDQVVIRSVFRIGRGSVQHKVVRSRREGDRDVAFRRVIC